MKEIKQTDKWLKKKLVSDIDCEINQVLILNFAVQQLKKTDDLCDHKNILIHLAINPMKHFPSLYVVTHSFTQIWADSRWTTSSRWHQKDKQRPHEQNSGKISFSIIVFPWKTYLNKSFWDLNVIHCYLCGLCWSLFPWIQVPPSFHCRDQHHNNTSQLQVSNNLGSRACAHSQHWLAVTTYSVKPMQFSTVSLVKMALLKRHQLLEQISPPSVPFSTPTNQNQRGGPLMSTLK